MNTTVSSRGSYTAYTIQYIVGNKLFLLGDADPSHRIQSQYLKNNYLFDWTIYKKKFEQKKLLQA